MSDSNPTNPQSLVEQFREKRNLVIDEVVGSLIPKIVSETGVTPEMAKVIANEQYLPYINYIVSKELNRMSVLDEVLTNLDQKEAVINTLAESSKKLASKVSKDELKELAKPKTPSEGKLSQEAKQSVENINSEFKKSEQNISTLASDIKNKVDTGSEYKSKNELNSSLPSDKSEIERRSKAPNKPILAEDELNKARDQLDNLTTEQQSANLNKTAYDKTDRLSKANKNLNNAKKFRDNFNKTGRETAKPSDTGKLAKGFYAKQPSSNPNTLQKAGQKIEDKAISTLPGLGTTRPIDSEPDSDGVGKGKMKSGGLYNSKGEYLAFKGKPISKGFDGTSNRDVVAALAAGSKNIVKGAGAITENAALKVQNLGSNTANKGEEIENSGKTETGEDKAGLGNAAKRFLGKDLKNTGKDIAKAGEAMKQVGNNLKTQAAQAVARALIALMPAIAAVLGVMLIISVICVVIILIICKTIENTPGGNIIAGVVGIPEEIRNLCSTLGFENCNTSNSTSTSGYDCKSNRIKAPGVDIADVRFVPDNKNLYYALIMMRSQEFNGYDENFVGGDLDSCGPYQQRISELRPGRGRLAEEAQNILGRPITMSCGELVSQGGGVFFDKLALERLKLEGAYDKIAALNLQAGNGSVYLLAQQLCNTQRPDAYNVNTGECPIGSYYVKNIGDAGLAFLNSSQYEKRKAGCNNGGPTPSTNQTNPSSSPATTNSTSFYQKYDFNQNPYNFNSDSKMVFSFMLGEIKTSAETISEDKIKQLRSLEAAGKISYDPGVNGSSQASSGLLGKTTVDLMISLANKYEEVNFTSLRRNGGGRSSHDTGFGIDIGAVTVGGVNVAPLDVWNGNTSQIPSLVSVGNAIASSGTVYLLITHSKLAPELLKNPTFVKVNGEGEAYALPAGKVGLMVDDGGHDNHYHISLRDSGEIKSLLGENGSNNGAPDGGCTSTSNSGSSTGTGSTTLLAEAKKYAAGKPALGRCFEKVADYIDAVGFGKLGGPNGEKVGPAMAAAGVSTAEARNFAEFLNSGDNAAKYGIKKLNLDNPYDAPPGSIVVVRAGAPGTAHPTAGDITVAAGNGVFYNDGEMPYGGREGFPPGNNFVLGIYVPI